MTDDEAAVITAAWFEAGEVIAKGFSSYPIEKIYSSSFGIERKKTRMINTIIPVMEIIFNAFVSFFLSISLKNSITNNGAIINA